jgi:hypothetical protein
MAIMPQATQDGKGASKFFTAEDHAKAKVAARAKKKHSKTGRFSNGGLVSGLAEDQSRKAEARKRRQRPQRPPFRVSFRNTLGSRVLGQAKQNNWSFETRRLAHAYVNSLLEGNGQVPEGLRGKPVRDVRWHFAMTSAKMRPSNGSFPGQDQKWFESLHRRASNLLAERRATRAASTPTVAASDDQASA